LDAFSDPDLTEFQGVVYFAVDDVQVHDAGHFCLHAKCQLVTFHPRRKFLISAGRLKLLLI
jgi:hypothetical protein